MTISFTDRVRVAPDVLVSMLDGESVVLNLNTESYFGLDDVGTRMWSALTTADSIQQAYEVLNSEYDADPQLLQHDLCALVEKLCEHRLVELHSADAATPLR